MLKSFVVGVVTDTETDSGKGRIVEYSFSLIVRIVIQTVKAETEVGTPFSRDLKEDMGIEFGGLKVSTSKIVIAVELSADESRRYVFRDH